MNRDRDREREREKKKLKCDPVVGFFHQHLGLPGQQDSGPEATFPYHYQDEARCLLLPTAPARCITDLQNRKNLIKIRNDGKEEDKEEEDDHLETQIFYNHKAETVDAHHVAQSSPILSSMLAAEPTLKQKCGMFPGN